MRVKNATTKGYAEVGEGKVEDLSFPNSKTRRARVIDQGDTSPTLDTGCEIGYLEYEGQTLKVRKLTPRECFRLQGFPDDFILPISDTHLYKQFGNSVTVNVIEAIAVKIKEVLGDA